MSARRIGLPLVLATLGTAAMASIASAHPGHVGHFEHPAHPGDFATGWQHPWTGLDHLLAMVAVGLLAVRLGGRAIWLLPATFLAAMLAGGVAGSLGLGAWGVESGILASVFVLGALIAASRVTSLPVCAALVAGFAFCHGHAHAGELASGGSLLPYAAGFLLGTAVLHATGIAAALGLQKLQHSNAIRWAGGAIATCGLLMLVGWL